MRPRGPIDKHVEHVGRRANSITKRAVPPLPYPPAIPLVSSSCRAHANSAASSSSLLLCHISITLPPSLLSFSLPPSLQSLSKRAPSWKIANNEKATTPIDWWPLINCASGPGEGQGGWSGLGLGLGGGGQSARTKDRLGSRAWRGNHLKIKSSVQL